MKKPVEQLTSQELMDLCDRYWLPRVEGYSSDNYGEYVNALNELHTRGPEIRDWARRLVAHPDYEARECGAGLLGSLARRGLLGEDLPAIARELAVLSKRPMEEDGKELQAASAAMYALRSIGERRREETEMRSARIPREPVMPLIAPEFAPLGFGFGFVEAPIGFVADALRERFTRSVPPFDFKLLHMPFPEVLSVLQSEEISTRKGLWVATRSERWKTAYFDNHRPWDEVRGWISNLAMQLHCSGLVIQSYEEARRIELYGSRKEGVSNLVWSVQAVMGDIRWEWGRCGPRQPFEETAEYRKRPAKVRFTQEMLVRYAEALGAPLDRSLFTPDSLLHWMVIPSK